MIYGQGTFVPTFQFAGIDTNHPVPEFYHEYPIFVDEEYYSALEEEYHTIYKVFDGESSQDIELIPESGTHLIFGKVDHIDVYYLDSEGFSYELDPYYLDLGDYSYDNITGILTLSDSKYGSLQSTLDISENIHSDIQDHEAYYIFEVKIEKYRAIDPESATDSHIATMQAIEQSILEYTYQFKHAQKTQQGLSEMFYTFFETSISTVITTAITLGVGVVASKLSSPVVSKAGDVVNVGKFIKVASSAATRSLARVTSYLGRFASIKSWQFLTLALSPLTETLQEIFVDPYLEVIVTDLVGKLGGDVFAQVFWSSMAEGGRETMTGPLSQFLFGTQPDTNAQVGTQHIINEIRITEQNKIQNNIELTQKLRSTKVQWGSIIKTGASLLLGTALIGIGGPMFFGASLVMGYSAISSFKSSFKTRKVILHNIISQDLPADYYDPKIVADSDNAIYDGAIDSLVEESQVSPVPKNVRKNPRRSIFERTAMWLRTHKRTGGIAATAVPVIGLLNPMMLLVGAAASLVIGGITIMAKKALAKSKSANPINNKIRELLSTRPPNRRYDNELIDYWIDYYLVEFQSFKLARTAFIEDTGLSVSDGTFRKKIKSRLSEKGMNRNDLIHRSFFTREQLFEFKKHYELMGTFNSIVSEFSAKSVSGVRTALKRLFREIGADFETWREFYDKSPNRVYGDEEVRAWVSLFEELGSFRAVEDYLSGLGIRSPDHRTVKRSIQILSDRDSNLLNGLDFGTWEDQFRRSPFVLSQKDIKLIIKKYEKLGSFRAVSLYLSRKGVKVSRKTIMASVKRYFDLKGKNYIEWSVQNSKQDILTRRSSLVGVHTHNLLEDLIIRYLESVDCKAFYEVLTHVSGSKTRADSFIVRDDDFRNNVERHQKILSISNQIEGISIDYTLSNDIDKVLKKAYKNYHGDNKLLIIVLLNTGKRSVSDFQNALASRSDVQNKENIKFLTAEEFKDFLGFNEDEFLAEYEDIIDVMKQSLEPDYDLEKLVLLSSYAKSRLVLSESGHPFLERYLSLASKEYLIH